MTKQNDIQNAIVFTMSARHGLDCADDKTDADTAYNDCHEAKYKMAEITPSDVFLERFLSTHEGLL